MWMNERRITIVINSLLESPPVSQRETVLCGKGKLHPRQGDSRVGGGWTISPPGGISLALEEAYPVCHLSSWCQEVLDGKRHFCKVEFHQSWKDGGPGVWGGLMCRGSYRWAERQMQSQRAPLSILTPNSRSSVHVVWPQTSYPSPVRTKESIESPPPSIFSRSKESMGLCWWCSG